MGCYGINTKASQGFTCSHNVSGTLSVCHEAGLIQERKVKRVRAYGINCQNRSMYPCTPEMCQTIAICHRVGVITYGFKYLASEKSRSPISKDIAQALATCPDSAVCYQKKAKRSGNA